MTDENSISNIMQEIIAHYGCKQCGKCCIGDGDDYICLTPRDIDRISKALKLRPESFKSLYTQKLPRHVITAEGLYMKAPCRFLDGGKCRIYSIRPVVCKFHPFGNAVVDGRVILKIDGVGLCPLAKEIADDYRKFFGFPIPKNLDEIPCDESLIKLNAERKKKNLPPLKHKYYYVEVEPNLLVEFYYRHIKNKY